MKIEYKHTLDKAQSLGKVSPERLKDRPTSPHLQIYKWEWSMAYSIAHRISAIGIGVIMLLAIGYIFVLAYLDFSSSLTKITAYVILGASSLCIFYYIFATFKYMVWRMGYGLDLQTSKNMGHASLVATIIMTAGVLYNANIV